jgi:FkbH-like protein
MRRVSFLGNYTIDILAKEYQKKDNDTDIYVSGFNQYFHEFLDKNSAFTKFNSNYSFLFLDGNLLIENFKNLSGIKKHIDEICYSFSKNNKGYLIVSNIYISSSINKIQFYNNKNNLKEIESKINLYLQKKSLSNNNLFIFDLASIIQERGWKNLHNNITWNYGRIRFNKFANNLISEKIINTINSVDNKSKKCLVLDLDNTLWGGVVGEDGIDGISLSTDGIGEAFYEFQRKIKNLKKKGIILAICSKNNMNDAKDVFLNHQFSLLKWNDFIVKKINWEPKNINIKEIAQELNIGEDSLVFIDDNPTEREVVRKYTESIVPEFPDSVSDLSEFIDDIDLKYFSKFNITDEDRKKTLQYKDNIKRKKLENSSYDFDRFIKDLDLQLTISYNNKKDITRISQLTQKTNQFNFTTQRYSELDIKKFVLSEEYHVSVGSVKDKFGDYGKVVACIIYRNPEGFFMIDTFLMSCRVVGKQIENYFFNELLNHIPKTKIIYGRYIATKKNILVKDKYLDLGFKLCENVKNNSNKKYIFQKKKVLKNNIKIINAK